MLALFVLRFFVFHLYESPKYLMGRGREAEAVEVVHKVARYNGKSSSLTVDMLHNAAKERDHPSSENGDPEKTQLPIGDTSALDAVRRTMRSFGWDHITPLFQTRKLALSTSLLIVIWGALFSSFVWSNVYPSSVSSHWFSIPVVRAVFSLYYGLF